MNEEKKKFLKEKFIPLLKNLEADAKGKWGQMNGQQMVEHFAGALKMANGSLNLPMVNSGESLEKARQFLISEKPLKENTKTPLMGDTPPPIRKANMDEAIKYLQEELDAFFQFFEKNPDAKTVNPIFGELDYAMNVQILYKHGWHHLKQFGLVEE